MEQAMSEGNAGGWFPWRYFVPRKGYFRLLRVVRVCPELRPHVDREAMLKGWDGISLLASFLMLAAAAPLILAGAVGFILTQVLPRADVWGKLHENSLAANRAVPPAEVKRRLGEQ